MLPEVSRKSGVPFRAFIPKYSSKMSTLSVWQDEYVMNKSARAKSPALPTPVSPQASLPGRRLSLCLHNHTSDRNHFPRALSFPAMRAFLCENWEIITLQLLEGR